MRRRSHHWTRSLAWSVCVSLVVAGITWKLRRLDFPSSEPAQIRAWAQSHAGLDLPLRQTPSATLLGARIAKPQAVEVSFRIDGRDAVLAVSKAAEIPAIAEPHWKAFRGKTALSWTARGQTYRLAVAIPADLEAACALCHIEAD
jgi:hypothetical protein